MADLPVADGGDGTLAAAIAAGYDRVPMTAAGPTGLRHRYTHVRLTIYPDGGVARFRVHGDPMPDPRLLTGTVDLAGLENGGTVIDCSNMFYPSR